MRYEGSVYRPPSESDAYILQATIGWSWNRCTYCDMYRDKAYRERDLPAVLEDLRTAAVIAGGRIEKVFVGDGDALGMPTTSWLAILDAARSGFPLLRRVSCYATAQKLLKKSAEELRTLRERGLSRSLHRPGVGRRRDAAADRQGGDARGARRGGGQGARGEPPTSPRTSMRTHCPRSSSASRSIGYALTIAEAVELIGSIGFGYDSFSQEVPETVRNEDLPSTAYPYLPITVGGRVRLLPASITGVDLHLEVAVGPRSSSLAVATSQASMGPTSHRPMASAAQAPRARSTAATSAMSAASA